MGPQPNSCGNSRGRAHGAALCICFNGATAKQLWKPSQGPRPPGQLSGFNGATAKQLWERPLNITPCRCQDSLQWGHSQTAVETSQSRCSVCSISSLQWGHSQTAVETYYLGPGRERECCASMGPQPNSCGNPEIAAFAFNSGGFNGATAKQLWKPCRSTRDGSWWRGFNGATAKQLWKPPSTLTRTGGDTLPLQWGHSQTAVETENGGRVIGRLVGLQWGHSQTAVETSEVLVYEQP